MATGKRELIDTGTDKRYVRRDEKGRFDEVVDVGRSLSQDRKRHAEHEIQARSRRPWRPQTLSPRWMADGVGSLRLPNPTSEQRGPKLVNANG